MKYHSVRNTGIPAIWIAEAFDDDGVVYTAIFIGKNARHRAEEYAEWKNNQFDPEHQDSTGQSPKEA